MTIYFKGIFNTWTCVPEGVAYTLYVSNGNVMLEVNGLETCLWASPGDKKIAEWNTEHGCAKSADDYAHIIVADIMRNILSRCDLCVDIQNIWCVDVGVSGVHMYTPSEVLDKKILARTVDYMKGE